jgi:bacteriocin-like protein
MKAKGFNKRLSLNKKTVSNLNKKEMQEVNGGCWTAGITCAFCNTIVSCRIEDCIVCRC